MALSESNHTALSQLSTGSFDIEDTAFIKRHFEIGTIALIGFVK